MWVSVFGGGALPEEAGGGGISFPEGDIGLWTILKVLIMDIM